MWPLERPKHVATSDLLFNIIQLLGLTDSSLVCCCYNTQWEGTTLRLVLFAN
jgi:hypothetical protein